MIINIEQQYMKNILLLLSVVLCFSCAKPYYGYSKQEWNSLSIEERTAVRAEYQDIISAKHAQEHEDLLEQRKQSVIDLGASRSN